ncbi:MAG: choice-of-anchor Q domain-containing protein [Gammaproteobacteria bacterium]
MDETYAPSGSTTGLGFDVVYTPNPAIGDLNITQSMTLIGAGPDQTIIGWGASGEDRIFHIDAVNNNISVSMQGLTVQNGSVPEPVILDDTNPQAIVEFDRYGGGITIGSGAAVVLVTGGHGGGGEGGGGGDQGGGGEVDSGYTIDAVNLSNIHVLNNYSGGAGGGIYNAGAPLTLENSIISGNASIAGNGGGIYNDSPMTIRTSTIGNMATDSNYIGNSAENGGGIFETGFHTSTIDESSINGNYATSGGGIATRRLVDDIITNTTIAGNVAQDVGGGINTNGVVTLLNDTIADNSVSSDSEGGGAGLNSFASGGSGRSAFNLINNILANNTVATTPLTIANCGREGQGGQPFVSHGYNLEDADTCGLSAIGDQTNTIPMLESLAMNGGPTETMALPQASPAVDTGSNADCPNNDQRDSLRPADGKLDGNFICDIGAFELFIASADLHINNMTAPDSVFVGDDFDVVVNIHIDPNATVSSTGVEFTTDPLPADLAINSATVATAAGVTACSVVSSVVTCVPSPSTLAPDATARMTINVMAVNPSTRLIVTAHVSQAAPPDPDPTNNTASVHVEAIGLSDLSITAVPPAQTLAMGADLVLPFVVTNAGPNAASQLQVGILIPPGLTYKAINLPGWLCAMQDASSVLCTVDSLASGGTVSGDITLTGSALGTAITTLGVSAIQRDTVPDNNTASVTTTVQQIADLSLTGSFTKSSIDVGTSTTLSLTAANAGPSDATGVTLVTQLPQGLTFDTATGNTSCTGVTTVTCTIGSLTKGQSIQIGLNLKAGQTTGSLNVTSSVQGDGVDPDMSNNTVKSTLVVNSTGGGGGGGGAIAPLGLLILVSLLVIGVFLRRFLKPVLR